MKTCTTCKVLKSLEDFHRYKHAKDGRRSACKVCRTNKEKERYHSGHRPGHIQREDLAGRRSGLLEVIKHDSDRKTSNEIAMPYWTCKCECGNIVSVRRDKIIDNTKQDCGCVEKQTGPLVHGMTNSPTWNSWRSMIERCTRESNKSYNNYGGRGIKVCYEWLNSFENFFKDMGERPKNTTLDRINVNHDYCKKNCKWSSVFEQSRNKQKEVKNIRQTGTNSFQVRITHEGVLYQKSFSLEADAANYRDMILKEIEN